MKTIWHDLWGCGRGPIRHTGPQTRLGAGLLIFLVCMISPHSTWAGVVLVVGVVTAWLWACRPPFKVVRSTMLFGLVIFVPYFFLLPFLPDAPGTFSENWGQALLVPWQILLRGLCGLLVSVTTVSSLSQSDLREALLRLPVPKIVIAILLQIVHQTTVLYYETRQISSALAVRGASSGILTVWRVLSSLPQVWLPRIIFRAERVAAVMELRGFCETRPLSFDKVILKYHDYLVLTSAGLFVISALLMRILGAP
ncbi:hypothetical protein JXQ70_00155 [bacterium]|nr:hypothetical protein [bacterium]